MGKPLESFGMKLRSKAKQEGSEGCSGITLRLLVGGLVLSMRAWTALVGTYNPLSANCLDRLEDIEGVTRNFDILGLVGTQRRSAALQEDIEKSHIEG